MEIYDNSPSSYCSICNSMHYGIPLRCDDASATQPLANRERCLVCHRQSFLGIHMPYPSRYDGEWICGECVRDILDEAIGQKVYRTQYRPQ